MQEGMDKSITGLGEAVLISRTTLWIRPVVIALKRKWKR
jgi:hypothetical protein